MLLPIIFDLERSTSRDFTETIKVLAGLALFVIADITNPRSAPLELQALVPDYQVPFVPIIQQDEVPFSMFGDLRKYGWVLQPVITYSSIEKLRQGFKSAILDRAWAKHQELQRLKTTSVEALSVDSSWQEARDQLPSMIAHRPRWRPWDKATVPRSKAGKAFVARNGPLFRR